MQKQVTKRQLVIDGIAQLKTKRQLIAQGILSENTIEKEYGSFTNIEREDPSFAKGMAGDLGKSLRVVYADHKWVTLQSTYKEYTFAWPYEAIDH